ncbi:3-hydroxyisobutyrate dehydrogenase [Anaerolineae bacterium]|nr:3-hydroxyisobutyrate dehydrogenase [Anaerolineae bacterium]
MKAGFIGLGAMGANMARNLAKAGLLEAVWNRTEEKARQLAGELGVARPGSPADLARRVDVVVICVSADSDLLAVIDSLLPGLNPSKIVIDHSTVSAETARKAAEIVRGSGADFLDAPVTGGVEGAKNGSLSIMVGGRPETLEKARPILEAESSRIVHMGEVGSGQATKAVNQIICAGINQAVTEALAFGAAQGLDLDKVIKAVSGGAAGNWFLDKRGPTMAKGTFAPGFKLALHHKDLKICLETAKKLGLSVPLSEMTLKDYAELIKQGFGNEDISALYRLKRPKK